MEIKTSVLLLILLINFASCSPIYIAKAGYYQSRLLLSRKDNQEIYNDSQTTDEIKNKITLTNQILDYATKIGLNTENRYKTTSLYKFPNLWVVSAAPEFSLKPYTWWFPFVGDVPYKGFFKENSAKDESDYLKNSGFDTAIRKSSAFSSIGWFQDPITTGLLELNDYQFTNTMFHELLHSTLWIPNHVQFNESLANIFGAWTTIYFYQSINSNLTQEAKDSLIKDCKTSTALKETKVALEKLYSQSINDDQKRIEKKAIYLNLINNFSKKINHSSNVNNASFLAFYTYYDNYDVLINFFLKNKDPKSILSKLQNIQFNKGQNKNPINLLQDNVINENSKDLCNNLKEFLTEHSI